MSYILEALKKAQAERQIGSTPTIHAPTLASAAQAPQTTVRRAPVIVAMVLMGVAIAGLATMLLRQQPGSVQSSTTAIAPAAAAPVAPATPANMPHAATAPIAADTDAVPATVAPPVAVPTAAGDPNVTAAAPASVAPANGTRQASAPAPASTVAAAPVAAPTEVATARLADATPATPVAPAPVEEHIQSLQELPEPIQRAIPQIALGGYMYSKNPSDRLLLIDKVLRKEGEEVAPGLLLEKLQPKQAVFRFRGYRYKIPL